MLHGKLQDLCISLQCALLKVRNWSKFYICMKNYCILHILGEQKYACCHINSSVSAPLCAHTSRILSCTSPSVPVSSPPSSLLSLSLSLFVVVLPCDRGEGSPGGALLGGHGVLLRQALLHLLLPDQDTQVDVLRRRPRQRGETQFGVCMLQHRGCTVQYLLHLQLSNTGFSAETCPVVWYWMTAWVMLCNVEKCFVLNESKKAWSACCVKVWHKVNPCVLECSVHIESHVGWYSCRTSVIKWYQ